MGWGNELLARLGEAAWCLLLTEAQLRAWDACQGGGGNREYRAQQASQGGRVQSHLGDCPGYSGFCLLAAERGI